jgi:hypothetical protein
MSKKVIFLLKENEAPRILKTYKDPLIVFGLGDGPTALVDCYGVDCLFTRRREIDRFEFDQMRLGVRLKQT